MHDHRLALDVAAIAHLSFAHFEAIKPYGTLTFDIAAVLKRSRRRLLRNL